ARHGGGVAAADSPGLGGEDVPDARAAIVLLGGALDLGGAGSGAEPEARRKQALVRGHRGPFWPGHRTDRSGRVHRAAATAMPAPPRESAGYPPADVTRGTAVTGVATWGSGRAALATPSSVPAVPEVASEPVMMAMSTAMNTPQPSPDTAAAASTAGTEGESASAISPHAVARAPATAKPRRRLRQSETMPAIAAQTADTRSVITVTSRTEPAGSSAPTASSRKKNR